MSNSYRSVYPPSVNLEEQKLFYGNWTKDELERTLAFYRNRASDLLNQTNEVAEKIAYIETELASRKAQCEGYFYSNNGNRYSKIMAGLAPLGPHIR